jgi:hypothetical protein
MRRRLLSLTGSLAIFCALSASARPARAQSLTGLNNTLGAIANAYGSFQAAQFVLTFFGVGGGNQMQAAVTEIENFIQGYRDQALVNNVNSDLNLFSFIASNYQSGLTNNLEAIFISQCINDLAQMQGDILNGNMQDAYTLAPAFNLLTVTFVGSVKAFGLINPANAYPQSTLNYYLNQAIAIDYPLTGSFFVTYDLFSPGPYSSMAATQGAKKMWPKYASSFWIDPPYSCNLQVPANADADLLSSCSETVGRSAVYPVALSGAALTAGRNRLNADRSAFEADQSVAAVVTSIAGLIPLGFNVIVDWDGDPAGNLAIGHVLIA